MDNRKVLEHYGVDALLINSTNEFLTEYSLLEENSRYKVTDFSGSTGDALMTYDGIFLFVDGRYHIQADLEVNHDIVRVIKLQQNQSMNDEIIRYTGKNRLLGVFSKKNSQARVETLGKSLNIKLLDDDIFTPSHADISLETEEISGISPEVKVEGIQSVMEDNEAILLTNSEDVSYLFNLRSYSIPYSSKIYGKAFITKSDIELFTPDTFNVLYDKLQEFQGKIFIDKLTLNAFDYKMISEKAVQMKENPIKLMKSVKSDIEIEHLKSAFARTDKTLLAVRDFINNNDKISEYDIAVELEKEFYAHGALGLSFKPIVAKDKNSALAHYSKSSKDEIISDGSLILIDCGGYYEQGLATDCTRVFVKGEPTNLQKEVYTTVLRNFLTCFHANDLTCGAEIDSLARFFFQKNLISGFVFNHGLGHGIGISVHEAPPALNQGDFGKIKLKNNMCFTIEPGLYNQDYFGIRLENSCYKKDGKTESFTNMPFEKKLINYESLTEQELKWLSEFEVL